MELAISDLGTASGSIPIKTLPSSAQIIVIASFVLRGHATKRGSLRKQRTELAAAEGKKDVAKGWQVLGKPIQGQSAILLDLRAGSGNEVWMEGSTQEAELCFQDPPSENEHGPADAEDCEVIVSVAGRLLKLMEEEVAKNERSFSNTKRCIMCRFRRF